MPDSESSEREARALFTGCLVGAILAVALWAVVVIAATIWWAARH
jgi:Mg/Co/Ni transporter MgtE